MKNLIRILLLTVIISFSNHLSAQWVQANGLEGGQVKCLAVSGTNLFAGTGGSGVFLSTNNGDSWTDVNTGLTNLAVNSLAVSGTNLFAGTDGSGVFLSMNNGDIWTPVNTGLLNTAVVRSFAVSGTDLFAGLDSGGVYLSTNNGTSWNPVHTGLTNLEIRSLIVSDVNIFAGTHGSGVWRRPLSEMITSVENVSNELLSTFSLEQNYPNPFNSLTMIQYKLQKVSKVMIKIYNTLGSEVKTLINEIQTAGIKSITWDGKDNNNPIVSSGIYYYILQVDNEKQTCSMILLK